MARVLPDDTCLETLDPALGMEEASSWFHEIFVSRKSCRTTATSVLKKTYTRDEEVFRHARVDFSSPWILFGAKKQFHDG